MTRLFLIRHAEPAAGWGGDALDPGLSHLGREQARAAAQALLAIRPLEIVSSPMLRCRETGEATLIDWGIARDLDAPGQSEAALNDESPSMSGRMVTISAGTPPYLPLEQSQGRAAGCLLAKPGPQGVYCLGQRH